MLDTILVAINQLWWLWLLLFLVLFATSELLRIHYLKSHGATYLKDIPQKNAYRTTAFLWHIMLMFVVIASILQPFSA